MINCSVIIAIFIWTVAAKDWEPLPDEHYMEYKVNGKRYEYGFDMNKQFSLSTDIQLGKYVKSIIKNYTAYLVQPFFEREVCVGLVLGGMPERPPYFFPERVKYAKTVEYKGQMCDYYEVSHLPGENVTEYVYMNVETNLPVAISMFYLYTRDTREFEVLKFERKVRTEIFDTPSRCNLYSETEAYRFQSRDFLINQKYNKDFLEAKVNDLVDTINPVGYSVKKYKKFEKLSVEQFMYSLLPKLPFFNPFPAVQSNLIKDLPENFDWTLEKPHCESHSVVRDQGNCGSCWAFGAVEAAGARYCIATNKSVIFSPQDLVDCDRNDQGCNGGFVDNVWTTIQERGVAIDTCKPYTSGDTGKEEICKDVCKDGGEVKYFKAKKIYTPGTGEKEIMSDIITYGPVQAAYYVFSDFQSYSSGIYKRTPRSRILGGHSITIVGWGVENDTKYWKVLNSWGEDWGENGYFRIIRGINDCNIEDLVGGGLM